MAKSLTANFITEKNKTSGAEIRTLLEIDALSGTLYYSDQALTVSGQAYTANVLTWPSQIISQVQPGEETVKISNASFVINNNPRIDTDIRPGAEIRIFLWFDGLTTADKLPWFTGIVSENIQFDIYTFRFTASDIGGWYDKEIGIPLDTATFPNADPDAVGLIQPVLYGTLTDQPCPAIVAGGVSTLDGEYSGGATMDLLDASVYASSGTVIIGEETGTYSGKTSNQLTGVSGISGTYPHGTVVTEKVASLKYMVAGHIVKAITNPRILLPGRTVDGAVAVEIANFSVDEDDTAFGGHIATVTLSNIDDIIANVSQVVVTQQPNQPITTQQTQLSPNHGHTPSSVTVSVNTEDVVLISSNGAQTTANIDQSPSFVVDNNFVSFGRWTSGGISSATPNRTVQVKRITVFSANGSPVQMRFKMKYDGVTLIGTSTAKLTINGVDKQTLNLSGGANTMTSNYFSISNFSDINSGNTYVQLFLNDAGVGFSDIKIFEVWYEVDYTPANPTTAVAVNENIAAISNRIANVLIGGGNSVSDQLPLIVDCDGYEDENPAHYTDSANALIEEPWDVIHHIIENHSNGNVTDSDIDLAGSFQDAEDNLPASYAFAFSIRQKIGMNRLVALLAQQTWCRFVWEAGIAKLNRIKDSGSSSKAIDTDTDSILSAENRLQVTARPQGLKQILNDIEVKYNLNYNLGLWAVPDAYNASTETTDANSITNFGTRQRTWLMFAIGDNSSMADDVRDKLLEFYKISRKQFVFPTWLKHVELERGDLIELTTTQLGAQDKLCEIIGVDYSPPLPIQRKWPELRLTLLDLAVILEELSFTISSTVSIADIQTYVEILSTTATVTTDARVTPFLETLLTTITESTDVTDLQDYVDLVSTTITATILETSQIEFDVPWIGSEADKLYLQSGQFTSTIKDSEDISAVDVQPRGISWNGTDTLWCGVEAGESKLYLQSGQFTSTLKDSEDVSGIDTGITDIAWQATDTSWSGLAADKLYLQSGQFTSTLKDSEDISTTDTFIAGISYDGANTPWSGNENSKLYLQSGQFTSTLKDSEDVSGVDTLPTSISWDGLNTLWCGTQANKLYLQSGQFSSTLKNSEDVSTVDTSPEGIGTNNYLERLSLAGIEFLPTTATATMSIDEIYQNIGDTPWSGSEAGKLYLQSGQFTSTIKDSEDISGIDINIEGITYDGTNTPWSGNEADKLYLQSGQFTSTLKDSEDVSGVDNNMTGISWDGTNSPWCGIQAGKLYLQSGQHTSTLKTSEDVSGVDNQPTDISYDGTNTPWSGSEADKLYLTSGQFTSTIKDSEGVSGIDTAPFGITYDGTNTPWCGTQVDKLYLQSGQFTSTLKTSEDISGVDTAPSGISTNNVNARLDV